MAEPTGNRKRWQRWQPKTARRARNRRRAHPLQVVTRVALAGLAAYGLWTVFHSPRLVVRRIEVVGTQRLSADQVRRLAHVPVGENIFRVNLYRARLAVEAEPQVDSAQVSRALPNAVRILVRERRPVFVVSYAGELFEADAAGILFRRVSKPTPRLPVLALANVGPPRLGAPIRPDLLKPALACLNLTAGEHLLLWKINVDGPHQLWLNMKVPSSSSPTGKTLRIRLGRPEDLPLKLADAWKVLAGRPQLVDEAQYLDVSCAGRPVYMAQTPGPPFGRSPLGSASARDSRNGIRPPP